MKNAKIRKSDAVLRKIRYQRKLSEIMDMQISFEEKQKLIKRLDNEENESFISDCKFD